MNYKNFISTSMIVMLLTSCSFQSSNNSQEKNNKDVTSSDYNNNKGFQNSNHVESSDITKAAIITKDFVKTIFDNDCVFEDDFIGETTSIENRYKILYKFSLTKGDNITQYVCRIWIQYFGGDWTNINDWDYGQLTIENVSTGEQIFYHGNMKKRYEKGLLDGVITINEIDFTILDHHPGNSISLVHKNKLTRQQTADVLVELDEIYGYGVYHLYTYPNTKEDDICYVESTGVFDFNENKIYESIEDYRKNITKN